MNIDSILHDKLSVRIWNRFFDQISKILRQVPKDQKDEIILELQGHVLESIMNDNSESGPDRIMNALDKLGDPEDFLRPIVADKLLSDGTRTFRPLTLFYGLYYNMFASARRFLISLVFAAGYLLLFIFLSASVAKLFIPEFGLYIHETGGFSLGLMSEEARLVSQEVLGFWLVPVGILLSVILYVILTKLLGLLMKKT